MKHYTYVHRRLDDHQIFYVGKGQGNRAWSSKRRNAHWGHVVAKHGFYTEIWGYFETAESAFLDEIRLIEVLSAWAPLTNKTPGGEGGASGAQHPMFGKKGPECPIFGIVRSPETRRRQGAAKKGALNPQYGKIGSASSTAKPLTILFTNGEEKYFGSVVDAAKILGCSRSKLSSWKTGAIKIPKKYNIKQIINNQGKQ